MRRLLAPLSAVAFLAVLIGCGGATGTPIDDGSTSGTDSGGGGTTTDLRPAAGTYTLAFSGAAGSTTVTGSGTTAVASNGTVTATLPAASASDSVQRVLNATVASNGTATGTVTVGANAPITPTALTFATNSNATYSLQATFTNAASQTEVDTFTLTPQQVNLSVSGTGTDVYASSTTVSGHYTATNTSGVPTQFVGGNVLSLSYDSTRSPGLTTHNALSTTLLSNGTFSGLMTLGGGVAQSVAVSGTWATTTTGGLALVLTYVNKLYPSVSTANSYPTVTEKLTLSKQ